MDNILEILVPLAFAAIYFFGHMFSGKKEDDEQPPPMVPRDAAPDEDREDIERQRRVQEEIRRKIMERRRAQSGDASPRPSSGDRLPPREAPARTAAPVAPPRRVTQERDASDRTFSWDRSDNAYDRSMESRLRQIEETKRRAERLKRQADKAHMKNEIGSGAEKRKARRSGGYFSGSVRESLNDPAAARVAFIYGEVLGRPVGLRDASASRVPGLNQ